MTRRMLHCGWVLFVGYCNFQPSHWRGSPWSKSMRKFRMQQRFEGDGNVWLPLRNEGGKSSLPSRALASEKCHLRTGWDTLTTHPDIDNYGKRARGTRREQSKPYGAHHPQTFHVPLAYEKIVRTLVASQAFFGPMFLSTTQMNPMSWIMIWNLNRSYSNKSDITIMINLWWGSTRKLDFSRGWCRHTIDPLQLDNHDIYNRGSR